MDGNNTQPATQNTQAASPAPAQAAAPLTPNLAQTSAGGGGKNKMIWALAGLVILILIIGGLYFYMTSVQKVASKPSPTLKPTENLESELNKIEVGDLDKEFSDVDKDLETL